MLSKIRGYLVWLLVKPPQPTQPVTIQVVKRGRGRPCLSPLGRFVGREYGPYTVLKIVSKKGNNCTLLVVAKCCGKQFVRGESTLYRVKQEKREACPECARAAKSNAPQ